MEPAIDVQNVTRVFVEGGRPLTALDDVSFAVPCGQIVGLLGANGAGKTTLTKIVSTLLLPTAGSVRVMGVDVVREPRTVRAMQSVVLGGDRGLYSQLSARENLRFFGMLNGLPRRRLAARVDASLEEVGLGQAADRKVVAFSKGMRQRLHIAIGMISEPRVLLLDEPTVGLDPVEAARLRDSIGGLRDRGVTVLLTSHYLLDVEKLADQVVMMAHGRITHQMTMSDFAASVGYAATIVARGTGGLPPAGGLAGADIVDARLAPADGDGDGWVLTMRLRTWSPDVFVRLGQAFGDTVVQSLEVAPSTVEEAFLGLQETSVR
jgi:ABC-2 type transport system ATP-binding protein